MVDGIGQAHELIGHGNLPKKVTASCRTFLQSWSKLSRTQSVEVIVHADADDVFPGMPSISDLKLRVIYLS